MRVDRTRKSAKAVISELATQLLDRRTDPNTREKLLVIEVIALRMNWNDLYNKLRYKSALHQDSVPCDPNQRKWWQE